jgi:hypothetical protein
MTRDAAEKVIGELIAASEALNESMLVMQAEVPDLFHDYRKRAAKVMGAIYLDLIRPIVAFHPDLDPGHEDDEGKLAKG